MISTARLKIFELEEMIGGLTARLQLDVEELEAEQIRARIKELWVEIRALEEIEKQEEE
jgi:hypothetical protein